MVQQITNKSVSMPIPPKAKDHFFIKLKRDKEMMDDPILTTGLNNWEYGVVEEL